MTALPEGFDLVSPGGGGAALPEGFDLVQPAPAPAAPARATAGSVAVPEGFDIVEGVTAPRFEDRNFFQRHVLDPLGRGKNQQVDQGLDVAGYASGVLTREQFVDNYLRNRAEAAAYPTDPTISGGQRRMKEAGDEGWGALGGYILENPGTTARVGLNAAVESLPAMGASILGGVAGAKAGAALGGAGGALAGPAGAAVGGTVGGVTGLVTGAGASSAAVAAASKFNEAIAETLQARGLPLTRENMLMALDDPTFIEEARTRALRYGVAVGAIDGLSMGVAGRIARPVAGALGGGVRGGLAGVGAEGVTQAAAGAAGEAAGQMAGDGRITDRSAIALEAIAELPGAAVEVPGAMLARRAIPDGTPLPAPGPVSAPVAPVASPAGPAPVIPPAVGDGGAGVPGQPAPGNPGAGAGVVEVPPGFVLVPPEEVPQPAAPAPTPSPPPAEPVPAPVPAEPPTAPMPAPAPVEPPAPAPAPIETPAAPAPTAARRSRVSTPDGTMALDSEFEVVDAATLQGATGELQPRDRDTRASSQVQIQSIAGNLNPDLLIDSPQSDRGAPIVDDTGTVLSGNGRVAALALARQSNPAGYDAYLKRLQAEGFDTTGVQAPVLVRRVRGLTPEQKREFVVKSNTDDKLAMSPSEQARVDRDLITPETLGALQTDVEGGVQAAANTAFVRGVIGRMAPAQQAAFVGADGRLTPAGARRIEAAIFARAYDDVDLTNKLIEDEEGGGVRNALLGAAPAWAQMRAQADPAFDITADLVAAVNAIGNMRRQGLKPAQFLKQQDAFNPLSANAKALVAAFYNQSLTRAAGWREARDFIKDYTAEVGRQANAVGDMFGAKPSAANILSNLMDKRNNASQGTLGFGPEGGNIAASPPMLDRAEVADTSPTRARTERVDTDTDAELDTDTDLFGEPTEQAPDTREDRVPRGGLAPTFRDYATSTKLSIRETAFRDAGLDPNDAINLPPAQQFQVLRKMLIQKFGFRAVSDVGKGGKANIRDALDGMLDAYHNIQMMNHALGLPLNASGLDGTLALTFAGSKRTNYFGLYSPDQRAIEIGTNMPGRSNAFAHEWMHALDHWLVDKLHKDPAAQNMLLSEATRKLGLDPGLNVTTTGPEAAFVQVMNALFFDQAKLAHRVLQLQVEASNVHPLTQTPTAKALAAQAELDAITKGAGDARDVGSEYRTKAAAFGDPRYWANPAEMIARAFEAYVAMKVEAAGGTNEFITKPDVAYLDMADRRLRDTFPKDQERMAIFGAFDNLIAELQGVMIFGADPVAGKPVETDVLDPQHWNKMALQQGEPGLLADVKAELGRIRNTAVQVAKGNVGTTLSTLGVGIRDRAGLKDAPGNPRHPILTRVADTGRGIFYSMRGVMKAMVLRNKGKGDAYLQAVVDSVATDPGTGRQVGETFEGAVKRELMQASNQIASAMKMNGFGERLTAAQSDRVRGIMLGEQPAAATQEEKNLAGALRRLLNKAWVDSRAAGIEIGYVRDTAYLQRILNEAAVFDDPAKFQAQADKVYAILFDKDVGTQDVDPKALNDKIKNIKSFAPDRLRDPDIQDAMKDIRRMARELKNLKDAKKPDPQAIATKSQELQARIDELAVLIRPVWSEVAATKWRENILLGNPITFATKGPDGNFTKERTLPPEADRLLEDFYIKDPVEASAHYMHQSARKREYVRRFGAPMASGANSDLDAVLRQRGVQDAIAQNYRRYDPGTPKGRIRVIQELTNPAEHNRLEMTLKEAMRSGANPEDIREIRAMIERITGNMTSVDHSSLRRLSTAIYVGGTLALLPRTIWTSFSEPLTVFLRTGSPRAALTTMVSYVGEMFRTAKTVQERAALARALGVVTTPLAEGIIQHQMAGMYGDSIQSQRLLASFFMRTGLTHLTNAQRRAALAGGFLWLRELAVMVKSPKEKGGLSGSIRAERARAEFRELGIEDSDMNAFVDWLLQKDTPPSLDELDSKAGRLFTVAANRFVDETIQNPGRVDKPIYATSTWGRLVYGISSFNYSFTRNVHLRVFNRMIRDVSIAQGDMGKGWAAARMGAGAFGTMAGGFTLLFLGQVLATAAREALFNGDKWEEKEQEGELVNWLLKLALSRTGLFGTLDPFQQAITGLKYERDLTSFAAGAQLGYFLNSGMQPILSAFAGRNSANTNSGEYNAVKAAYQMLGVPALAAGLSVLPGGPLAGTAIGLGLQKITSNSAADQFATAIVGEKGTKTGGSGRSPSGF